MVLYATLLKDTIPDVLGHILVASIISAPAAITVAKTMIPETLPVTSGDAMPPETASSSMEALSPNSRLILTYAMCGFANPGNLGIMIGGMGSMAPDRRSEIASLGVRAVLAGTIAPCMAGAIVGLITALT